MTPGRRQWRCSGLFIVNFENIPHIFSLFPFLNLNGNLFAWNLMFSFDSNLMPSFDLRITKKLYRLYHFE